MINAIPYFLNLFNGSANESCRIHLNFDNAGDVISNISGLTGSISGQILPNTGNFWQNSGSGLFSGNYVKITTDEQINLANATYAMVYEKYSNGGATLISTVENSTGDLGQYYQGFEFGVTANNYLYFEYYTDKGPQVFNTDIALSDKSSVFLSIENGAISFGNYDFFKSSLNSVSFPINNEYIFNPRNIYIGYNDSIDSGVYCYNKKFTGYVDNFLVFSPSLYTYDLQYLNSGFAHIYTPASNYVTSIDITGITGYYTGVTGYYTYVTGQELVATGVVMDGFGIEYSGYAIIDMVDTLSGTGIIPLTGKTSIQSTGFSGESVNLNTEYISSFGKRYVNLMHKIRADDIVEISIPNTNYPYNYYINLDTEYDEVNGTFYNNYLRENSYSNLLVFVNGVAQNSGNFVYTGSVYNKTLVLENDYIIKNNEIKLNDIFNNNDIVYVDISTGVYNNNLIINNFAVTGAIVELNWPNNYNIFYNGQKLISGNDNQIGINAHYGITGSGIYFKNTGIFESGSGKLFALPRNFSHTITGSFANIDISRTFFNNYSEVYLNGIRQFINDGYMELARIDSNTGSGIFDIKTGILYNNNDL